MMNTHHNRDYLNINNDIETNILNNTEFFRYVDDRGRYYCLSKEAKDKYQQLSMSLYNEFVEILIPTELI